MPDEKPKDKRHEKSELDDAVVKSGEGTEAKRMGGVEPAKRQAERDWEDSAKESGD